VDGLASGGRRAALDRGRDSSACAMICGCPRLLALWPSGTALTPGSDLGLTPLRPAGPSFNSDTFR
jgi:hypothetical protein